MIIEVLDELAGAFAVVVCLIAVGFFVRLGWLVADRLTGWQAPGLSIKMPPRSHARVWTEGEGPSS